VLDTDQATGKRVRDRRFVGAGHHDHQRADGLASAPYLACHHGFLYRLQLFQRDGEAGRLPPRLVD
jgi:hypothetical protein